MNDTERLAEQRRMPAPDGYEYRVVVDHDWRLMPFGRVRGCRAGATVHRRSCRRPAVAELRRGSYRVSWWAYCERHLYGRWIEADNVVGFRLRNVDERLAPDERPIVTVERVTT